MHIYILGAGWVGVVMAGAFARAGHDVVLEDISSERIALLRSGKVPFLEAGLDALLSEGVASGKLVFSCTGDAWSVVPHVIFSCVGTPQSPQGDADLSAVFASAEHAVRMCPEGVPFVIKSTVPPGTCREVAQRFSCLRVGSNPEFLAEGSAVHDALVPSRIVYGSNDSSVLLVLADVYRSWIAEGIPCVATDALTSELAKYAANAFLATKISFVNELSELAEVVGADMQTIARTMGMDPRIGPQFLQYGLGYGGSCFPKDTQALLATASSLGVALPLVREAEARNVRQRERYLAKILEQLGGDFAKKRVAILGVAYKPNTSDVRSSPALTIISALLARGVQVTWYDPGVRTLELPAERAVSCTEACAGADSVFVATAWDEIVSFAKNNPQLPLIWGRFA